MSSDDAIIGVSHHGGWALLVTVAATLSSQAKWSYALRAKWIFPPGSIGVIV